MKFILVLADLSKATISASTFAQWFCTHAYAVTKKFYSCIRYFLKESTDISLLLFWTKIKWTSRDCAEQHLQTYFHSLFLSNWLIMLVQLFFSSLQLQKVKQKSLRHYIFSKKSQIFLLPLFFLLILKIKCCFPTSGKFSEMQCFLSDYCSISS